MPENQFNKDGFIPKHGGYQKLFSYKKAEIIYDGTVYFCNRFFSKYDRTKEQMIQAARSGKQNIAEGSMFSATSKEAEIKLTNVARSSLEELLNDYRDFLRTHKYSEWHKDHPYAKRLRELNRDRDANYDTFKKGIEHENPEISANVLIGLTKVAKYLLTKQIAKLEQEFLNEGGIRERMAKSRYDKFGKGQKGIK